MGTLNAFYVRIDRPQSLGLLFERFPEAYIEHGMEYYAVDLPANHFAVPTAILVELSNQLETSVIWLQFQSAVDAFHYRHWKCGELVRGLVYGCFELERTWEGVEGASESWEKAALFDLEELEFLLEDPQDEAEEARFRRIWREELLEVGSDSPMVDSRETARKVAEYYRLPGWSLLENEA